MTQRRRSLHHFYLYDDRKRSFREIHHGYVCGREEGASTYEKDAFVSRKHCRFIISGNEVYVEDVGSTNHTRVNSVPIQSGRKRRLRLNDVIEIGKQRLILTHQNLHPPGHTQDATRRTKGIAAILKDDGSVTRFVPSAQGAALAQRTLLLLKPSEFQKLKRRTRVKGQGVKPITIKRPSRLWLLGLLILSSVALAYFLWNPSNLFPLASKVSLNQ